MCRWRQGLDASESSLTVDVNVDGHELRLASRATARLGTLAQGSAGCVAVFEVRGAEARSADGDEAPTRANHH
jgi:hypothetical protein